MSEYEHWSYFDICISTTHLNNSSKTPSTFVPKLVVKGNMYNTIIRITYVLIF